MGGLGTYNIKNESDLLFTSEELAANNQKLAEYAATLQNVLNQIRGAWVSSGQDAESFANVLQTCISTINERIVPALNQYSATMKQLANNTMALKNKSI